MVLIQEKDWEAFKQEISFLIQHAMALGRKKDQVVWLTQKEACKLLNVSKNTLHSYKCSYSIPFSKIGRKVMFKQKDILDFLEERNNKQFE